MSTTTPIVTAEFPCCGPATAEGLAAVQGKVADARADILSAGSANTQSILTDANGNATTLLQKTCADTASIIGAVERANYVGIQETGKFGLANLEGSRNVGDKVYATTAATQSQIDKYGLAGINTTRAESDRIGSALDRASYGLSQDIHGESDKITGQATNIAWAQDANEGRRFAELRTQNTDLRNAIAAAQAAAAECCCEVKQDILRTGKELGIQAASNFGAIQVEASKNTAAIQLQAAVNLKDSFLEQSKWFALAEKTAMLNKCELADKLAACCCEIKEAVTGTAQATQQLIQSNETTRVRDALAAANTESLYLRLKAEQNHHYPYPYPYPHPHGGSGAGGH